MHPSPRKSLSPDQGRFADKTNTNDNDNDVGDDETARVMFVTMTGIPIVSVPGFLSARRAAECVADALGISVRKTVWKLDLKNAPRAYVIVWRAVFRNGSLGNAGDARWGTEYDDLSLQTLLTRWHVAGEVRVCIADDFFATSRVFVGPKANDDGDTDDHTRSRKKIRANKEDPAIPVRHFPSSTSGDGGQGDSDQSYDGSCAKCDIPTITIQALDSASLVIKASSMSALQLRQHIKEYWGIPPSRQQLHGPDGSDLHSQVAVHAGQTVTLIEAEPEGDVFLRALCDVSNCCVAGEWALYRYELDCGQILPLWQPASVHIWAPLGMCNCGMDDNNISHDDTCSYEVARWGTLYRLGRFAETYNASHVDAPLRWASPPHTSARWHAAIEATENHMFSLDNGRLHDENGHVSQWDWMQPDTLVDFRSIFSWNNFVSDMVKLGALKCRADEFLRWSVPVVPYPLEIGLLPYDDWRDIVQRCFVFDICKVHMHGDGDGWVPRPETAEVAEAIASKNASLTKHAGLFADVRRQQDVYRRRGYFVCPNPSHRHRKYRKHELLWRSRFGANPVQTQGGI